MTLNPITLPQVQNNIDTMPPAIEEESLDILGSAENIQTPQLPTADEIKDIAERFDNSLDFQNLDHKEVDDLFDTISDELTLMMKNLEAQREKASTQEEASSILETTLTVAEALKGLHGKYFLIKRHMLTTSEDRSWFKVGLNPDLTKGLDITSDLKTVLSQGLGAHAMQYKAMPQIIGLVGYMILGGATYGIPTALMGLSVLGGAANIYEGVKELVENPKENTVQKVGKIAIGSLVAYAGVDYYAGLDTWAFKPVSWALNMVSNLGGYVLKTTSDIFLGFVAGMTGFYFMQKSFPAIIKGTSMIMDQLMGAGQHLQNLQKIGQDEYQATLEFAFGMPFSAIKENLNLPILKLLDADHPENALKPVVAQIILQKYNVAQFSAQYLKLIEENKMQEATTLMNSQLRPAIYAEEYYKALAFNPGRVQLGTFIGQQNTNPTLMGMGSEIAYQSNVATLTGTKEIFPINSQRIEGIRQEARQMFAQEDRKQVEALADKHILEQMGKRRMANELAKQKEQAQGQRAQAQQLIDANKV